MVKKFEFKEDRNHKLNYYFLLISLYLFLIIFFILLTSQFKLEQSKSYEAKKSVEKVFSSKNGKKSEDLLILNNIYNDKLFKHIYNKILDIVSSYKYFKIVNNDNKDIIRFSIKLELIFNDEIISPDIKIILNKIFYIIGDEKRFRLKVTIPNNEKLRFNMLNIGNYINKIDIYNITDLAISDEDHVIFALELK